MTNKLTVLNSFVMPVEDETFEVTVSDTKSLAPNCWLWNESVGYLEVVKYNLYNTTITVKNLGRRENAKKGTEFPTCMEFLITAPTALDPYNPLSTCLAADFTSPTVGHEAYMSVGSTYVLKVDDQIIVDSDYRYAVTQVVNATTLKVRNEGLGKEGIIEVGCDSCVPVQVVSKLNCCPIPSGDLTSNTPVLTVNNGYDALLDNASLTLDTDLSQYDNSTSKFINLNDIPRGTLQSNSSLLEVTGGVNNTLDNITLSLDTDLSKYDNSSSEFITVGDIPRGELYSSTHVLTVNNGDNNVLGNIELSVDTDLSKYDNTTSRFLTPADKKNLTSNTSVLTVTNGTGATLENTSLSLDTDLSKYDNTTSTFVSASDKKNLISTSPILTVSNGNGATLENTSISINTDLALFNNDNSKFLSEASLPEIGDGSLTILQDGELLGSFSANSSNDVTIDLTGGSYLPLSGGTMTGDILVAGSGVTLGDPTQEWDTVYTGKILSNSTTVYVGGNDPSAFYFVPVFTASNKYLGASFNHWTVGYINKLHLGAGDAWGLYLHDDEVHTYIKDVTANTLQLHATDAIHFQTTVSGTITGMCQVNRTEFRPFTNNQYNLGANSYRWGTIYYNTMVPPSDIRYKDNIENLESGLNTVNDMEIKTYTYKHNRDHIEYGIIAQDIVDKYPELVCVPTTEDEPYGVYLHNFLFVAVRAIQELSSKVDELNAKIKVLEGKL